MTTDSGAGMRVHTHRNVNMMWLVYNKRYDEDDDDGSILVGYDDYDTEDAKSISKVWTQHFLLVD